MRLFSKLFFALVLVTTGNAYASDIGGGVDLSGFVDTSFYTENTNDTSTFSLDQVEVDIEKKSDTGVGFRFDLQHTPGSETTGDDIMEQGYVYFGLAGVTVTAGKFNAPIGFELLDAPDMYQFSHAQVFNYGIPTNLTGVMVSGGAGMFDFSGYAVNGWDIINDDNQDKTFGGRLGVTPSEGINVGFSYISGNEGSDAGGADTSKLSVFDLDATITAVENLTLGFEYNSGTFEGQSAVAAGDDATWSAYLVMANYAFSDTTGLTIRYDSFHDNDGARLGNGVNETRDAITISPNYSLGDGLLILAEYKQTKSDKNTFVDGDGNATDTVTEIAVEMTYSF